MGFEAVVYCVDNSEYMINGDIAPSRILCQNEAVNKLATSKVKESPETTVGLISMAGPRSQVIVPSTREPGDILRSLHKVPLRGRCDFLSSLKVAQLVLKNRPNKKQKQRIVMFVGSPIEKDEASLVKQAKLLKKNSIAIDVINFGVENTDPKTGNAEKLKKLVSVVSASQNSHYIETDGSVSLLDKVCSSFFNPPAAEEEQDAELQMAIRMSLQETNAAEPKDRRRSVVSQKMEQTEPMEDDELAKAIAMSLKQSDGAAENMEDDEVNRMLGDKAFLEDLIDSLPEVDKADIDIDEVMATALETQNTDEDEKSDETQKEPQKETKKK